MQHSQNEFTPTQKENTSAQNEFTSSLKKFSLPQKTFFARTFQLYESDFECNGQVKPHRIMQLLQDVATEHGTIIGVGWDVLDSHGMLWVLSKINLVFSRPITMQNRNFTLYTWPLAPNKFFAERCFCAVDEKGEQLFSATSLWMIIGRDDRKILPAETMNMFCHSDYSDLHADAPNAFLRVRKDETYEFCYEKEIRRSDLDKNGHVNNTNYILFALDVLPPNESISAVEIVYHKELKLHDKVQISCRRVGEKVFVVGENDGTCFTTVFTTRNKDQV